MEIDVIIPLYKPGKELFTLLDKLGSQSVPVHQVILLNQISGNLSEYQGIPCIQKRVRSWRYETDGSKKVFRGCLRDDDTGCHAER